MNPEIILNLWYYVDEDQQFILALAGRAYMANGTDEEKTALLKQLSVTDYPLALKLPTPDRYVTFFADKMRPGIAPVSELDNPATQLFEDLYQAIEADLVKMAEDRNWPLDDYKIPDNPLFVMTALYQEDEGVLRVLDNFCEGAAT